MPSFVLEIGVEEIPARFLEGLEEELRRKFTEALALAGLSHGHVLVCSTPRRAAIYAENLAEYTEKSERVVTGPPLRAAFDSSGAPSKAAEGFARSQGVPLADTFTLSTDKGDYLAARVRGGGESALTLLTRLCPEIIAGLAFPKRMRWGSGNFTFARPLRWILALLDGEIIPFKAGDTASGRCSRGHRVHGPGPFVLDEASRYLALLREKGGLVPDGGERISLIRKSGDRLALEAGGKVIWNDSLLREVRGLCERPVPLLGSFDPGFLEMPRPVLLTSMEHHQKSFGLEDGQGRLLPHFLTVLNLVPPDTALVRKGWERVLRARLEDARFFWHSDLRDNFEIWLERLDKVVFLAGLGSMGEKARRLGALSAKIAGKLLCSPEDAARAGLLAKADLVTQMVGEFDTLQGIMGSIYAAEKGEKPTVSAALAEQYLPAGPDSPLPSTLCGTVISLADKADSLAGCFALGLAPTGTADPYSLRRAALGIARILVEKKLRLDAPELFAQALELYGERGWKFPGREILERLNEFFAQRLKNYFTGQGAETLLAESVISAGWHDAWGAAARLEALKRFSRRPEFAEAVLTFKRPANILRKQGTHALLQAGESDFDPSLLRETAEKNLAQVLEELKPLFDELLAKDDFDALFARLSVLKPLVDAFFNEVMVMCEDERIRLNRLKLLRSLVDRLRSLTDFDALQV
ncbi:MAG: glycine--tRNA ligase subunit beta [Deltaproteobacteria bacterium]|jgi:glycyl-tRNA synthetase beta chain|nr:glycine--tRNA ligase subunit beta [Deltaproteobacteria bacterium]